MIEFFTNKFQLSKSRPIRKDNHQYCLGTRSFTQAFKEYLKYGNYVFEIILEKKNVFQDNCQNIFFELLFEYKIRGNFEDITHVQIFQVLEKKIE